MFPSNSYQPNGSIETRFDLSFWPALSANSADFKLTHVVGNKSHIQRPVLRPSFSKPMAKHERSASSEASLPIFFLPVVYYI
jgi:hypothetical protein